MIDSSICECDHKCETRNAEPENGTNRGMQNPVKPAGWWVRVEVWAAKSQQIGFLDKSGTETTCVCDPNQDRWPVTSMCCWYYCKVTHIVNEDRFSVEDTIANCWNVNKDTESEFAVTVWILSNSYCETVIWNSIVQLTASSIILTQELQARNQSNMWDNWWVFVK
jgi:hypothetical protein